MDSETGSNVSIVKNLSDYPNGGFPPIYILNKNIGGKKVIDFKKEESEKSMSDKSIKFDSFKF